MKAKPAAKRRGKAKKPDARQTNRYLKEVEKRGELNPEHRRDFDNMLDDVVPPATKKK